MKPFWLSAFLDFAPEDFDRGVAHWESVTGYTRSAPRGDTHEFATLVPSIGDDFLRVQRLEAGPSRVHLDVHVTDARAAAEDATRLGATVLATHETYAVLSSPGGLTFCLVPHFASLRPIAASWPGGFTSLIDQVCIDIPAPVYASETAFWQAVTGWELRHSAVRPEFSNLLRPTAIPLRLLLQRLDESDGPVSAHLDLSASDRAREIDRHLALGAVLIESFEHWTVLRDPVGATYCITGRSPETGLLP
ncbi:VOC family protein [Nocardioides sp.]|uniref:VOC family protein n=1 Tax=Nocardioides sp. TaxID=35761 RepID=UPI0031FE8E3E|nr:hypothetical protein [Nocardioides sp.]